MALLYHKNAVSLVNKGFYDYFTGVFFMLETVGSDLPIRPGNGRQTLPIHPGDEPLPLLMGDRKAGVRGLGPDKAAAMQAALT